MSSAQGIRAGKAYVELFADHTKLQAGLKAAQSQIKSFASTISGMGAGLMAASAGIMAPLGIAMNKFIESGEGLSRLSQKTGMSVSALSVLKKAADYAGVSIDEVETAVLKSGKAMEEAYGGNKTTIAAFSAIGISLADIKKQTPDQMFHTIASAIGSIKEPVDRAYAAFLLYGRSGAQMLPLINNLSELEARAKKFGGAMSALNASRAKELGESFKDIQYAFASMSSALVSVLAPALQTVVGYMANAAVSVRDWVKENKGIAIGAVLVAGVLGAMGSALLSIGAAAGVASFAIGGLSTMIGTMYTTLAPMIPLIGGVVAALAVVGGGMYLLATKTEIGRGALGKLGAAFADVKTDAINAWDGISAALQSGNIAGAARVAWALVKLEFTRGTSAVMNFAQAFAGGIGKIFLNIGFGINYAFTWAFNKVVDVIQAVGGWILNFFAGIVVKIGEQIRDIGMAAGRSRIKGLASAGYGTAELGADLIVKGEQAKGVVNKEVADRKAAREQDLSDYSALWDEKIAGINDWMAKGVQNRDNDIASREDELKAARDEMVASKEAFDKSSQAKADKIQGMADIPLGGLINQITQIKDSAAGAFNTIASFGMGAGSTAADRTAAATEQTSKNTKIIAEAIKGSSSDNFAP